MNAISQTEIWLIAADDIDKVWPQVAPLLQKAIDRGNTRHTLESTYQQIYDRRYNLVIAERNGSIQSACVTTITEYPAETWMTIILCGGTNMVQWVERGGAFLEKYAKHLGCRGIEVVGRPGWGRVLGFRRRNVIMEKVF